MEINLDLKNKTIEDETYRWVEIYKITNKTNQKIYIGQAVSHIRKHNKFVPHGTIGRFNTHIQEALGNNNTKYSCRNLNNAIKKYGPNNFTLQLLYNCNLEDANKIESEEIIKHNSLVPNGYNLVTNCKSFCPSIEFRQSLSTGLIKSLVDKRIKNIEEYLKKIDICLLRKRIIAIGRSRTTGKNLVAIDKDKSHALCVYFLRSKRRIAPSIGTNAQISQFRYKEYRTAGANIK